MNQCVQCSNAFPNNYLLIDHVSLAHLHNRHFSCAESNCSNIYSKFHSYRKHRLKFHKDEAIHNYIDKNKIGSVQTDIEDSNDLGQENIENYFSESIAFENVDDDL